MGQKYLKILSLGGFARVTPNLFVYENDSDILVVDCGIGFPEVETLGADLLVPDISYLKGKQDKIRAIILSHGHDDHIGGLPYVLPQLPANLPVFAPKWAAALSRLKLEEFGISANIKEIDEKTRLKLGSFSLEFIKVTHSIPDTLHLIVRTPIGIIYHAADFKLDLTPVIGEATHKDKIRKIGKQGVLCLFSDCLRAENFGFTPPEAKLEEMFEKEIVNCSGKFFVTAISSNISRFKQAIDVSLRHGRKIVVIGRSIQQNLIIAQKLKYLQYSPKIFIKKRQIKNFPPDRLSLLVAGSQAQIGSALDRIVQGEMEEVQIQPKDKVIFSTDYIPGNETAIYRLIDNVYRLGAEVVYPDIHSNVHVSGHGSQKDLGKLIEMVRPKYLVPIGGDYRHMAAYRKLAGEMNISKERVIMADDGQVIEFIENQKPRLIEKIETRLLPVTEGNLP